MKYMALIIAVALVPGSVMAQPASPSETQLQMERRQRRSIVRPRPPDETVARDADTAAVEAARRERERETIRELRRPPSRRPDLDSDVKGGIQSQRLKDALR
jgi:hypothetical protein